MVSRAGTGGVRPFLQLLEVQALRAAADRDLLRRVAAADEAAFRVVAERHGPMVFGVCARLLGNRHDAEDALQATFLVLARRAAAVRQGESLASWLHGVARRVALRLRRADRRRTARERAAAAADGRTPADALAWAEVRAGLDEELARLPAAYRDVLVLCYLEGLSRDEAGQRLGLDAGAVKGRLERGRRLLGKRLVKRGIGLSAGLAALAAAPDATAALRLGRLASDPAAASPRAAALSHEFLKGVAMTKVKLITAGAAAALVLVVGVGTAQPPAPPKEPPPAARFRQADEKDTDEAFIRRVSRDLRGTDPTPAEVHFFLASKDANRRATLVDLFVKERAAKEPAKDAADAQAMARKLEDMYRRVQEQDKAARLLQQARDQADQARLRARQDAERAAVEAERHAAEQAEQRLKAVRDLGREKEQPQPEPKKGPATAVPQPMPTVKGVREADPTAAPKALAPPVPAPPLNLEVLKVRVQLAELTVREKMLAVAQLEEQARAGVVSRTELDRAKLEVERAQLLLREAQLTAEQAHRAAPPAARP